MIYYHCAHCGEDVCENEVKDFNESGVLTHLACDQPVEERDTDALTERLAAAEERAERLAAACKIGLGVIVRSDLKGKEPREAIAALTAALTATPAPQRTAEREAVIEAAREVVYQGDLAWREHANDIRALGSHMQYFVLPEINRLRRMLAALDATDSERAPADTQGETT